MLHLAEDTLPMNDAEANSPAQAREKNARVRRCIVSGEVLPEARLVRFVADPQGVVVPDVAAKLPGRGMWVSASAEAVNAAAKNRLFARAGKANLSARETLAKDTEALLAARLVSHIGLARKAGELFLGFDTIDKALRAVKPAIVVLEASDAGEEGRRKLQQAAIARGFTPFTAALLSREELSLAVGRANVVHAALKSGRIAELVVFESGRLAGFRPLNPWTWNGFSSNPAHI